MNARLKFETQLHNVVKENKIQDHVHFFNKNLNVAAIDVLVQNSQERGVLHYQLCRVPVMK